jgi:hypothetical protein
MHRQNDNENETMNKQQISSFGDWTNKRGVWPRLTHEETFKAGWDSAVKWEPIETAPLDSYILLSLEGNDWAIGCWNRNIFDEKSKSMGMWVTDDATESTPFFLTPTHWMPLPALPPKFMEVSCSACGESFGPGDHGFSHCSDHQAMPSVGQDDHMDDHMDDDVMIVTRSMAMDAGMPDIEGMEL